MVLPSENEKIGSLSLLGSAMFLLVHICEKGNGIKDGKVENGHWQNRYKNQCSEKEKLRELSYKEKASHLETGRDLSHRVGHI
jgi:hypothetical protein